MPEDVSIQLLAKATSNIHELFDLVIRMEERLAAVKETQENLDDKFTELSRSCNELAQRLSGLESVSEVTFNYLDKISECEKNLNEIDKRLSYLELNNNSTQNRWNKVISFVIQLLWVLLAAWLLAKLNLQPPI